MQVLLEHARVSLDGNTQYAKRWDVLVLNDVQALQVYGMKQLSTVRTALFFGLQLLKRLTPTINNSRKPF